MPRLATIGIASAIAIVAQHDAHKPFPADAHAPLPSTYFFTIPLSFAPCGTTTFKGFFNTCNGDPGCLDRNFRKVSADHGLKTP